MPDTDSRRWFHVILTTYAAWLPGDPRGFRTRDHRQEVAGDYKQPPPPGLYDRLQRIAEESLTDRPRTFSRQQRCFVLCWLHEKLIRLGAQIAIVAVNGRHVHLLVKLPPIRTRQEMGMVKRHVTFRLRESGDTAKVWADGAKFVPIKDRAHQVNAFKYIADHVKEGAAVWKHGEPVPESGPGDAVAGL